jgi:hypothetical protein
MVRQEQTDGSGKCAFAPTAPAIYLARAKEPGYLDAVVAVNLQNTPTGTAHSVLKPKPAEAPTLPPKGAGGLEPSDATKLKFTGPSV